MKRNNDRIAVLGDLHIGVRNCNLLVAKHQLDFFEFEMFPYMIENGIDTIVQMGDVFDGRKFTGHKILHEWHQRFFSVAQQHKFKLHIILGNHDLALRNSLEINTPSLFLSKYDNVTIYDTPSTFKHGDFEMLMVPWICSENETVCLQAMADTKHTWVAGHFEIQNFEMHKGQVNQEGLDPKLFNKFDTVLSGHFHTRSNKNHICYVGTPYEMTWIDYGDQKGFHVIDICKQSATFIPSTRSLFEKVVYDDKIKDSTNYHKTFVVSNLKDKYVKVVVVNKTNPYEFEKLMDKLYTIPMLELKIVEDLSDLDADNVSDDDIEFVDTQSLITSYIDSCETDLDKERIKKNMRKLYVEAMDILQ